MHTKEEAIKVMTTNPKGVMKMRNVGKETFARMLVLCDLAEEIGGRIDRFTIAATHLLRKWPNMGASKEDLAAEMRRIFTY